MKNFRISLKNVAAIVACFAVSLMLFMGCEKDDPTPEPDNGIAETGKTYVSTTANVEKVYTLKVSKSLLKSTATATDTNVLLYVDKSGEVKISTDVVTSSVGESLTLTPTGGSLTPFANGEIEITGETVNNHVQIGEDRVLGVPGMAVNYVYNGINLLEVNGGKPLLFCPELPSALHKPMAGF